MGKESEMASESCSRQQDELNVAFKTLARTMVPTSGSLASDPNWETGNGVGGINCCRQCNRTDIVFNRIIMNATFHEQKLYFPDSFLYD